MRILFLATFTIRNWDPGLSLVTSSIDTVVSSVKHLSSIHLLHVGLRNKPKWNKTLKVIENIFDYKPSLNITDIFRLLSSNLFYCVYAELFMSKPVDYVVKCCNLSIFQIDHYFPKQSSGVYCDCSYDRLHLGCLVSVELATSLRRR